MFLDLLKVVSYITEQNVVSVDTILTSLLPGQSVGIKTDFSFNNIDYRRGDYILKAENNTLKHIFGPIDKSEVNKLLCSTFNKMLTYKNLIEGYVKDFKQHHANWQMTPKKFSDLLDFPNAENKTEAQIIWDSWLFRTGYYIESDIDQSVLSLISIRDFKENDILYRQREQYLDPIYNDDGRLDIKNFVKTLAPNVYAYNFEFLTVTPTNYTVKFTIQEDALNVGKQQPFGWWFQEPFLLNNQTFIKTSFTVKDDVKGFQTGYPIMSVNLLLSEDKQVEEIFTQSYIKYGYTKKRTVEGVVRTNSWVVCHPTQIVDSFYTVWR